MSYFVAAHGVCGVCRRTFPLHQLRDVGRTFLCPRCVRDLVTVATLPDRADDEDAEDGPEWPQ